MLYDGFEVLVVMFVVGCDEMINVRTFTSYVLAHDFDRL